MFNKHTLFGLMAATVSLTALADPVCTPHPKKERMPRAELAAKLKKQGYQIKSLKLDDSGCYELDGRNKQGREVDIYFDAKTGNIVQQEIDNDRD